MAQYKRAGVSGEIRSQLGTQIETLDSALNPDAKKPPRDADAGRLAAEQRTRENIAELEERRVTAARALEAAAEKGQAAYEREVHSQQLQNELLGTEQRIRASFLDLNGKQRAGTEAAMQAEIERAKAAVQTRDALDQQARAQLDIGKDEQTLALLKAKTDAYATMGSVIKDATAEEEYAVRMADAASIADDTLRKKKEDLAAAIRAQTIALHGAEAAHAAEKKAEEEAARATEHRVQELQRVLSSTFNTFFTDLLTKGKSVFQSLWDSAKAGFFRMISDMLAAKLAEKFAGMLGLGAAGAAKTQDKAGDKMIEASKRQLEAANKMNGIHGAEGGDTVPGDGIEGIDKDIQTRLQKVFGAIKKYAPEAVAGFAIGYGIGQSATSTSHGACHEHRAWRDRRRRRWRSARRELGGPIGAAVGALAGFVGGIIGAGKAMKEADKATTAAADAVMKSMADVARDRHPR
jgi:hypothetical protein